MCLRDKRPERDAHLSDSAVSDASQFDFAVWSRDGHDGRVIVRAHVVATVAGAEACRLIDDSPSRERERARPRVRQGLADP